jgi:hypothetical protein
MLLDYMLRPISLSCKRVQPNALDAFLMEHFLARKTITLTVVIGVVQG